MFGDDRAPHRLDRLAGDSRFDEIQRRLKALDHHLGGVRHLGRRGAEEHRAGHGAVVAAVTAAEFENGRLALDEGIVVPR